jgi:hypothetical protein
LLCDEAALNEMKQQGLRFVAAHQGATDKAMGIIGQQMESSRKLRMLK